MSIPEYVERYLAEQHMTDVTPAAVAEELHNYAERSLKVVREIRDRAKEMSKELRLTLCDIEAMCHLGSYYASKILGATQLHMFEKSGNQEHKRLAVQHLLEAQKHWEKYAEVASALYRPQLLARTRVLDWKKILEDVEKDVVIARRARARE